MKFHAYLINFSSNLDKMRYKRPQNCAVIVILETLPNETHIFLKGLNELQFEFSHLFWCSCVKFGVRYPCIRPIPVAARSKVWVCDSSRLLGLRVRTPTPPESLDVSLLLVLFVVGYRSLRLADHSSSGVLTESRLSLFAKPRNGRA